MFWIFLFHEIFSIFFLCSLLGLSLHQHRNLWISSAKCRTHSFKGCEKIPGESFQRNWSHHFLPLSGERRGYLRETIAIIFPHFGIKINTLEFYCHIHGFFLYFQYFVVTFFCFFFKYLVQYVIRFVTSKPSNAMEKKLVKKAWFFSDKAFLVLHACKQQ